MSSRKSFSYKQLTEAVISSFCMSDLLKNLGMSCGTNNYASVEKWLKKYNIDYSHFIKGGVKRAIPRYAYRLEDILVENSEYDNNPSLKKRLFKAGMLKNECSVCGISEWQGKELVCQLDHINGIHNDNRLENLRILCPNCHSQTETFCRGQKKKVTRISPKSPEELHPIDVQPKLYHGLLLDDLQKLLWEKPTTTIAAQLGVSDKAVEKFASRNNLSKPPRGYWAKKIQGC